MFTSDPISGNLDIRRGSIDFFRDTIDESDDSPESVAKSVLLSRPDFSSSISSGDDGATFSCALVCCAARAASFAASNAAARAAANSSWSILFFMNDALDENSMDLDAHNFVRWV